MPKLFQSKLFLSLAGLVVLSGALLGFNKFWNTGISVGYAPDQPIPFSHKIHAGVNEIPCLYCHSNADNSKHATVPGVGVCMNCHTQVKVDSPYIKQIQQAFKNNKPIEWIKVHDNADFVTFNHKRHIMKGFACENCHGPVKEMDKIRQDKMLRMGFCLDCHRKNSGPTECYTCHQ